jgi:hypothetical protein
MATPSEYDRLRRQLEQISQVWTNDMQSFVETQNLVGKQLNDMVRPLHSLLNNSAWAEHIRSMVRVQTLLGQQLSDAVRPLTSFLNNSVWAEQVNSLVDAQVALSKQLNDAVRPLAWLINSSATLDLQKALSGIDFSWVEESLRNALPPNWRDLGHSSRLDQVLAIMDETGWCLVWCPRGELIEQLVDAPDVDARTAILLNAQELVLEDLRECLADTDGEEIADHRDAAWRAIDAFASGHDAAAQALAASDLSALINGTLGLSFHGAEQRLQGDPMEASINAFREQAVFNMVSLSLQRYYADRGDPVPASFSRHATAHSISNEQYTKINSLAALLLLVAFIKELDLLLDSQAHCLAT